MMIPNNVKKLLDIKVYFLREELRRWSEIRRINGPWSASQQLPKIRERAESLRSFVRHCEGLGKKPIIVAYLKEQFKETSMPSWKRMS